VDYCLNPVVHLLVKMSRIYSLQMALRKFLILE